jgi:hypothetical protein
MLYEITVRSTTGDEHIMANYLLVILDQAGHQWLLSLPENQFDSWSDLRQTFIDNFITTCDQRGNKYDLECIRDRAGEPLRDYIRRFSNMRLKIPSITHDKAVSAFIKGLRHHDALRSKLLRKQPSPSCQASTLLQRLLVPCKTNPSPSSRPANYSHHVAIRCLGA